MTNDPLKKELQQALAEREEKMYHYYKSVFVDGFEGGYSVEYDTPVLDIVDRVREEEREAVIRILKNRRCPPCGITDFGRATIDGFNRALDYVEEDLQTLTPNHKE